MNFCPQGQILTGLPAVRESGNSPGIWVWFFPALERSGNYVISPKVREKSGNSTIHLFYYIILHLCAYSQKKIRIFRAVNPTKTFFVKKNNSCRVSATSHRMVLSETSALLSLRDGSSVCSKMLWRYVWVPTYSKECIGGWRVLLTFILGCKLQPLVIILAKNATFKLAD